MQAQPANVSYSNSNCVLVFLIVLLVLYIIWYLYWDAKKIGTYWGKKAGTEFSSLERGEGSAVTLYYNPGCPHCRRIMPTWQNIQMQFGGRLVGAIDCSSNVCPNDIAGVPTIRSMRDHYDYKGERDYDSLYSFVSRCVARV